MVGGLAQTSKLPDAFADEEFDKDANGCPLGKSYCISTGCKKQVSFNKSWSSNLVNVRHSLTSFSTPKITIKHF